MVSELLYGIPEKPKTLRVHEGSISSDIFISPGNVERLTSEESALYSVKETELNNFISMITRGYYFLKLKLTDDREFSYVIRDDESLLAASSKWLKCIVQIAE